MITSISDDGIINDIPAIISDKTELSLTLLQCSNVAHYHGFNELHRIPSTPSDLPHVTYIEQRCSPLSPCMEVLLQYPKTFVLHR